MRGLICWYCSVWKAGAWRAFVLDRWVLTPLLSRGHIRTKWAGVPGRDVMVGKGTPAGNPETWVQIPALSATDSVTSSKSLTQYNFKKHMYVSPALGEDWGGTSRPEIYDYRCFYFGVFLLAKGSQSLLVTRLHFNRSPVGAVTALKGAAVMVEVQALWLVEVRRREETSCSACFLLGPIGLGQGSACAWINLWTENAFYRRTFAIDVRGGNTNFEAHLSEMLSSKKFHLLISWLVLQFCTQLFTLNLVH